MRKERQKLIYAKWIDFLKIEKIYLIWISLNNLEIFTLSTQAEENNNKRNPGCQIMTLLTQKRVIILVAN